MENLDVEGGTSQNTSEILNGEFTIRLKEDLRSQGSAANVNRYREKFENAATPTVRTCPSQKPQLVEGTNYAKTELFKTCLQTGGM